MIEKTFIPLSTLIQDFFRRHLVVERNASPHTIWAYRDAMREFLTFCSRRSSKAVPDLDPDDLGREALLAFLDDLEVTRKNSASTRNARLAAIHSFFRYMAAVEPSCAHLARAALSVPYKRCGTGTFTCMDKDEVEHLLRSIDPASPEGRRDIALLMFLYNTGARTQEVVDLRLVSVRLEAPFQVRIFGKGRKERLVPLWPQTVDRLRHMLQDRKPSCSPDDPLFLSTRRQPLTRRGLRYIVYSRVAKAAVTKPSLAAKRISPHSFRHTTALHLLQSGVELNVIRCWLGHVSITTTHQYVEIDMKMKQTALEACVPPRSGKRPSWQKPDILAWLESL